eukprot:TRINITY_DN40886_c0_g1_i1.p1 TRINITY_DN40886_c0_g1~~TRINITY_DN40886_c0_g1_i1.p1  ORF type:complete len:302 (+),score=58.73 TRINITY_DN40886_c0_g1_i1:136-1041(+)
MTFRTMLRLTSVPSALRMLRWLLCLTLALTLPAAAGATDSDARPMNAVERMKALFQGKAEPLPTDAPEVASARLALRSAYQGVRASGSDSQKEGAIYGELTEAGGALIFEKLALGPEDVFCDGGSGVGRAVVQAVLETKVGKAMGIEFVESRHEAAQLALARLQANATEELARQLARVEFVSGDLQTWPGLTSGDGCNKIFLNSLAFPDALTAAICQRLLSHELVIRPDKGNRKKPVLVASSIHLDRFVPVCKAPCPSKERSQPHLLQVWSGYVAATWDNVAVHIYEVRPPEAATGHGDEL